jgi:histidine triad (HIT) family protein
MSDCIFCKIASKQIQTPLLFENERVIAFRDIAPKAPTHLLVVPKEHLPTVNDFQGSHAALVGELILTAARLAAREGIAESGYRLIFNCNAEAGQVVFHVHLHVLGGWGKKAEMV